MMDHSQMQVKPVIQELRIPAGIAGPAELTMDVRCFIVPHAAGLLLIDTGVQVETPMQFRRHWTASGQAGVTSPTSSSRIGIQTMSAASAMSPPGAHRLQSGPARRTLRKSVPPRRCARSWTVTGSEIFRYCTPLAIPQATSASCTTTECCL